VYGDKMFPVIAIRPNAEFFDFTSKYEDGGAQEVVVELERKLHEEVEKMALATYKVSKCEVYSRVDMIVTEQGVPYILEVNTLPGMTKNSLIPKSAAALNIDFSKLIDMIIQDSMKIVR
jgi:D-alanine-D-alanine ligase